MRWWLLLLPLLLAACAAADGAALLRASPWPGRLIADLLPAEGERVAEWDGETEAAPEGAPALALGLGPRRGIARLVQEEGERRLWRTPGGVVVATEGARVVATAGLREMLAATRFDGPDPLARLPEIGEEEWRGTRMVDLMRSGTDPARMRFGVRLDCRLRAEAAAEDTLLVRETCRGDARFVNRFWADARSRAVFRSEQWIGDGLPPLVVEVVSAPAAAEVMALPR
jgi:hypothetical protein